MRVGVAALLGKGEIEDVLVGRDGEIAEQHDWSVLGRVCFGQLKRRQLQIEAVDDDQVGFLDLADGGGRRIECVTVGALGDERDDGDAVAADLLDDVAQRGDGRNDEQSLVLGLATRSRCPTVPSPRRTRPTTIAE